MRRFAPLAIRCLGVVPALATPAADVARAVQP
jgi:hypothetical protein